MSVSTVIIAKQVLLEGSLRPAAIHVREGKISSITSLDESVPTNYEVVKVDDECVVLPGIVDSHVHVNEPG
jgi:allantoinase